MKSPWIRNLAIVVAAVSLGLCGSAAFGQLQRIPANKILNVQSPRAPKPPPYRVIQPQTSTGSGGPEITTRAPMSEARQQALVLQPIVTNLRLRMWVYRTDQDRSQDLFDGYIQVKACATAQLENCSPFQERRVTFRPGSETIIDFIWPASSVRASQIQFIEIKGRKIDRGEMWLEAIRVDACFDNSCQNGKIVYKNPLFSRHFIFYDEYTWDYKSTIVSVNDIALGLYAKTGEVYDEHDHFTRLCFSGLNREPQREPSYAMLGAWHWPPVQDSWNRVICEPGQTLELELGFPRTCEGGSGCWKKGVSAKWAATFYNYGTSWQDGIDLNTLAFSLLDMFGYGPGLVFEKYAIVVLRPGDPEFTQATTPACAYYEGSNGSLPVRGPLVHRGGCPTSPFNLY